VADSEGILGTVVTGLTKWIKQPKSLQAIVGFICIVGGLAGLFYYQASAIDTKPLGGGGARSTGPVVTEGEMTLGDQGTANEGTAVPLTYENDNDGTYQCTVTLEWTDEANANRRYTNQPDTFDIEVTAPNGETKSGTGTNPQGGSGNIVVNFTLGKDGKETDYTGVWSLNLTLSDAGDQEARFWSFFDRADSANTYTLTIQWLYGTPPSADKK